MHAYNLSTQETETGRSQVQVILGYTARLCLKDGSGGGLGGLGGGGGAGGGAGNQQQKCLPHKVGDLSSNPRTM